MKRNFNFLIDAFKNLLGEYKFGVFIYEDHWDMFYEHLSQHLDISMNSLSRIEVTENFIFLQNKNSKMFIYKISNDFFHVRGQRYNFVYWDGSLDESIINEIIRRCATLSPGCTISLNIKNKCDYCICKTCAIAQINSGAPGCGNCEDCDLIDGCRSCNEYYNPEPHINDIINQMLEYNHSSSNFAYVFPKDEDDEIKIKNIDNFIEGE